MNHSVVWRILLIATLATMVAATPSAAIPPLNNGGNWTSYPDLNPNSGIPGQNSLGEIGMDMNGPGVAPDADDPDPDNRPDPSTLSDLELVFESARTIENADLCPGGVCESGASTMNVAVDFPSGYMTWTYSERGLWLLNSERVARGLLPFEGTEVAVTTIAQAWSQNLIDTDAFDHNNNAFDEIAAQCSPDCIGTIQSTVPTENLASRSRFSFPNPAVLDDFGVERAIYLWMYFDRTGNGQFSDQEWGHRHALLWDGITDDHGSAGSDGFIGIGVAKTAVSFDSDGTTFQGEREVVVWNGIDTNSVWPTTAPIPDTESPEIMVSEVADATSFPATIAGTATDNTEVTRIRLRIRDTTTGNYYNIATNTWQTNATYNQIPITPGPTVNWTYNFNPTTPATGTFEVTALANDAANNLDASPYPQQQFTIDNSPPDTENPEILVNSPADDEVVPPGQVTISGSATDDIGITRLRIRIRDVLNGEYWNTTTEEWQTTSVYNDLPPVTGAWSYTFDPGRESTYELTGLANDAVGNLDVTPYPQNRFIVAITDIANPEILVTSPENGTVLPAGPVTVSGTATDDVAVTRIRVRIRELTTNTYWNATTASWQAAVVYNELPPVTPWALTIDPVTDGTFEVVGLANDAANNIDVTPYPQVQFSTGLSDTEDPEVVVSPITSGTSFPATIAGTATDNTEVTRIRLRIRDTTTGNYYNIATNTWQTNATYNQIPITPGPTVNWTYNFNPTTPATGTFEVTALANDAANNLDASPYPQQQFTILGGF